MIRISLGMNSSMFANCLVFCDVRHVWSLVLGQNVMFGSVRSSVLLLCDQTSLGTYSLTLMFANCSVFCDVRHVRSSILGQNVMFKSRCSDIQCSECSKFGILVFVPRLEVMYIHYIIFANASLFPWSMRDLLLIAKLPRSDISLAPKTWKKCIGQMSPIWCHVKNI